MSDYPPGTRVRHTASGRVGVVTGYCEWNQQEYPNCRMVLFDNGFGRAHLPIKHLQVDYSKECTNDNHEIGCGCEEEEKTVGKKAEALQESLKKAHHRIYNQRKEIRRLNRALKVAHFDRISHREIANENRTLRERLADMQARVSDAEATVNQVRSPRTYGSITVGGVTYSLIKKED